MNIDNHKSFFNTKLAYLFVLVLLLLIGFFIRLMDLTDPPMAFHPTRQMREAIIVRSIYLRVNPNADPENVAYATSSALIDYVGRLKPPITESVVVSVYLLIGQETLWISRLVTSLFWCSGGLALFLLVRKLSTIDGALISHLYNFH